MKLYVLFFVFGLVCLVIEMSVFPSGIALILSISAFALSVYEYHGKLTAASDYLFLAILWGTIGVIWVFFLFRRKKAERTKAV